MNYTIVTGVVAAIIFGGGGFYAGMQYTQSQSPAARFAQGGPGTGGNFAGRGAGGRFGGGANGGGGFATGSIVSIGQGTFTIQLATGTSTGSGTKIVIVDNNTQISKTAQGSQSDLTNGENVTVAGTPNSDGSITATMVQIRPTSMTGRGTGQQ